MVRLQWGVRLAAVGVWLAAVGVWFAAVSQRSVGYGILPAVCMLIREHGLSLQIQKRVARRDHKHRHIIYIHLLRVQAKGVNTTAVL